MNYLLQCFIITIFKHRETERISATAGLPTTWILQCTADRVDPPPQGLWGALQGHLQTLEWIAQAWGLSVT